MKLKHAKAFAGIAALIICLAMLPPSPARAAESIRLIAVDSDSSSSLWVKVFLEHFIPEVDRRLAATENYEVEWNPAFGGTLAKPRGVLTTLQYDLADIGIVTTPYHPDKIPFYSLPYITPFVSNDIGLIARTMTDLTNKYPQIKDAWKDYNLHYLTSAGSIDTYNIVLTDPVESIADLQGRKIGGVGLALLFLEGSGAVGVVSALPDWYNYMATGLMSGSVVWPEAAAAYRFYEVAPYMLDIRFGGAASKAIAINQRTWDRLPEEVQIVIQDVANDYRDQLALETDRISSRAREIFAEQGGVTIPVSEEQRQVWASKLPDLAGEWVKVMSEAGLPGREILADYMQIMRDNNQPVMRQWDQE
jgi:C4-dicarboxylate-binding protein DctP